VIEFVKLHGTGNDFIFVDARERNREVLDPGVVTKLCHRNFGIGADGVLALVSVDDGVPRMRIYNADGSVAQMCGNGLRCFAKVLSERLGFDRNPLPVDTDAGRKSCQIVRSEGETRVRIKMGAVTLPGGSAPLAPPIPSSVLPVAGKSVTLHPVATGNPHAILIGDFSRSDMDVLGPALATHPFFPEGTNVEFVQPLSDTSFRLTVCERGVGFTLACGTGSVAATAVAAALGLVKMSCQVSVHLPGGTLLVTIEPGFETTWLAGPAVEVFSGVVAA